MSAGTGGGAAGTFAARALLSVAKISAFVGISGSVLNAALYDVDGGERAVIFDRLRGVLQTTSGEGTHLLVPLLQYPIIFDVRTRPRTISSATGTKDLQQVNLSLRVLARPMREKLPEIYKHYGQDYDERVLPSIGNEVLKATVAQFNADQLLTMREEVSANIRDTLTKRASEFNICLEDVALTHLSFSSEYSKAIEYKQVAQQEAERSKYVVLKADQERNAAIIRAEGESEAARLISEATRAAGPALLELRRIEAAKEVAHIMSRSRNISYLPQGANLFLGVSTATQ
mmetsp:Transcript_22905/g.77959  ORF Transcript_22905/g.77959 Transcript_22905/m.77959 type:complete len:288 (+) Transcript_22905:80-943(+)|eukprot:CAMPEP_0183789440 /NCGR_PEP_ID=MMETSP0803_2-20130417/423_1 /TAXON_ID=195967 /ORGANISM="Crustomastix stigmata, Strain CCMP3273" /LENGTH=287 /DNA_ID=CAMNT_0026033609 /DNA_START=98 /DNA_END=961 /DNA_ORIENTATION=-